MRRILILAALLPMALLGCGDDDDDTGAAGETTVTTTTSAPPSTTTTTAATTTTVFDGSTSPTSAPGTASGVVHLTDVDVGGGTVAFTFEDDAVPGFDVGYVEPPIREDGSGHEIEVDGEAFLSVRLEPASAVDLGGDELRETYTGPDRIAGDGVIVEAVETGDFEANLTWVLGVDRERPYRIEAEAGTLRVVVSES